MQALRSTHHSLAQGFPILLEVSHLKHTDIDLLYSLIEIWLYKNCKSEWNLEQIEESATSVQHHYIRLVFSDPREAIFYKLSPSYLFNKPYMPAFMAITA